jgi:cytochrome b involved in lipid metabolism
MVWGRLSKRGQEGDERLNTIHGRYAHTASGIKMLWMSILDSYETFRTRMELPPWTDLEWNSLYWVLRDHSIAMNVPATDLAMDWREELRKHRARVLSLKYRKWPVATAIVGNTLEDYLGRFPADARRPMRQLLAIACPEEMLDGMGYRALYPGESEFKELRDAMQRFYREEVARKRNPHSLSSHIEIEGWKSRVAKFGPSERGPSMPHVLTDPSPPTTVKEAIQPLMGSSCPFSGDIDPPSPTNSDIQNAVTRMRRLQHNFGYAIGQSAAMKVEDVLLSQDMIEVTTEEVALHCTLELGYWVIVGAYVYDVSLAILDDIHPGGKAILLKYVGKKATSAFKVHSEDARIVACNFIVAKLKQSTGNIRED